MKLNFTCRHDVTTSTQILLIIEYSLTPFLLFTSGEFEFSTKMPILHLND